MIQKQSTPQELFFKEILTKLSPELAFGVNIVHQLFVRNEQTQVRQIRLTISKKGNCAIDNFLNSFVQLNDDGKVAMKIRTRAN